MQGVVLDNQSMMPLIPNGMQWDKHDSVKYAYINAKEEREEVTVEKEEKKEQNEVAPAETKKEEEAVPVIVEKTEVRPETRESKDVRKN